MNPPLPTLRQRLRQGDLPHAGWLALRDPLAAGAVARSGNDPTYLAARRRVVAAAHAHGLSVGLHGDVPAKQREALQDGIDWVVVASDLRLITEGAAARLGAMAAARG